MLGLLKALAELGMIDVHAVSVENYSNLRTGGVGWNYFQTTITLLFDWLLFLVRYLSDSE